jgi:hypothetical protein
LLLLMGFVFIHDKTTKDYFIAVVCLFILIIHVLVLPFEHGLDNFVESISLTVLTYAAFSRATAMTSSDRFLQFAVYFTLALLFTLAFLELFLKYFHHPIKRASRKVIFRLFGPTWLFPTATSSYTYTEPRATPTAASSPNAVDPPSHLEPDLVVSQPMPAIDTQLEQESSVLQFTSII